MNQQMQSTLLGVEYYVNEYDFNKMLS